MAYVNCQNCRNSDCARNDRNYGYTMCDAYVVPKPTNADRIRAMSDEELATWILENINCDKENIMCCPELYKSSGKCNGRCLAGRLDWLKQEVTVLEGQK